MNQTDKRIKPIRNAANIGLWGTLVLIAVTVAEHYLDKYVWVREITANDYTKHLFTIVGVVLVVVDIAVILFTLRKQIPRLRQLDDVGQKLQNYKGLVRSVYYVTLAVVLMVSAFIVITHENTMIMLLLLTFVMLALNYPNMYKTKADLGLNDEEMKELFGEQYDVASKMKE